MDVKSAYLNAPIDCDVYMDQAEGFEILSDNNDKLVYKLNKSLYGLKQSGRNWNNVLQECLLANDFVQSSVDHCIYIKHVGNEMVAMLVWVDDLIIAASNDQLLNEVKEMFNSKFHMKDMGVLSYFISMSFVCGDGFVKMNQSKYIQKVLEKFEMSDCKHRSTPSEMKILSNSEEPADATKYRELVGSLIYAMTCMRQDLCWIVTKLSQYLSKPQREHYVAAKHVLRYLKGTINYELCYVKCDEGLSLIGYSDADWVSSVIDRRSTTGYYFSLSKTGPLISWKSKKQPVVALSTCEAQYIALSAAVQEGLYLSQLLRDNQGTIALSKNPVNRSRAKHIDIRYHFIRSEIARGRVVAKYCPTENMVADIIQYNNDKTCNKSKIGKV